MKKSIRSSLILIVILTLVCAGCAQALEFHIADREEGQALIRSCTDYYASINERSLEFFLQRKGGTVDEFIDYSADQVMEFSEPVAQFITDYYSGLDSELAARGLTLPASDPITVVCTTGEEALGSAGYTHGTTIYVNGPALDRYLEMGFTDHTKELLAHELFHCMTRSSRQFRSDMYSIINFTLNDTEFDIPADLAAAYILNPDVEHHDAYASFTIDGEKKDCYLLFMTDTVFEKPGDSLFTGMYSGIVPVGSDRVYRIEEVPDFWDVVGSNTDYVEDPEECMATNFSYALVLGSEGFNGRGYPTPGIIESILEYLSSAK